MNRKKITIYIEKKEYLDFEFITSFVNSNLSFVPREINFQKRRSKKIFSSDDLESKFIEDDLWLVTLIQRFHLLLLIMEKHIALPIFV
ncbi:MAG: hypothetical protein V9E88_14405 [Ferruginibacter sp.]